MTEPLILIVEDEEKLAGLLSDYVVAAGYRSHCLFHGDEVIGWLNSETPAAILLDLMLPGKDGLHLCREIREFSQVPVLKQKPGQLFFPCGIAHRPWIEHSPR